MTHQDIYTKFMIEYDKANVTSSYPSLTEYEVATVLDKAYNALIAQKVTGNNYRRAPFEADTKAISDIAPLIAQENDMQFVDDQYVTNQKVANLPSEFLYFVNVYLSPDTIKRGNKNINPMDKESNRMIPTQLVDHQTATKFFSSAYNLPWVKIPVCYIEDNKLYVVYDPIGGYDFDKAQLVYIKRPNRFVKDTEDVRKKLDVEANPANESYDVHFFSIDGKGGIIPSDVEQMYQFECNSTVAEELVSLAISFALENIESPRLNTKLNMRGLEA